MNAPRNTSEASGSASGTPMIAKPGADARPRRPARPGTSPARSRSATGIRRRPRRAPGSRTSDGKILRDELPDVAPAVEEEDQREQHQQRARDDLGDGGRGGQRAAGQLRLVVAAAPRSRSCRRCRSARCSDAAALRSASCACESMLWVTCSTRSGTPSMNWLTTKVRMPPRIAMPPSSTSATAPPRGSAAPVQPVDDRHQQRAQHQREQHRDDDDFELLDHPQQRDDRGQDHQQPPRPRGGLADERSTESA